MKRIYHTKKNRLFKAFNSSVLLVLVLFILVSLIGCKSKTVVRKIPTEANAEIKSLNGVTYRLPRTVVSVTIPVKLTISEPGPFLEFQPCFFPDAQDDEIVRVKNRKIQIKSASFDSFGEPDPNESYIVSIKGGLFENKSLLMEFSPRGVLKKGEATSEDKSLEFALKTFQTTTAIGGAIVGLKDESDKSDDVLLKEAIACNKRSMDYNQKRYDELKKGRDSKTIANPTDPAIKALESSMTAVEKVNDKIIEVGKILNKKPPELSSEEAKDPVKVKAAQAEAEKIKEEQAEPVNNYLKAKNAFAKLSELLKRRDNMVSSPSDASADSFKLRIAETDKTIEAYRQLFLGIISEAEWSAVFQMRPNGDDTQYSKPLFVFIPEGFSENGEDSARICTDMGLVKDDGVQPPPKFKGKNCLSSADRKFEAVWLKLDKDLEDAVYLNKIRTVSRMYADKKKERGWYFRIAAKGNLFLRQGTVSLSDLKMHEYMNDPQINNKSTELARIAMPIAQIGVVASIPASGGGRTQQSALELNGITGELVNFRYSSTSALDKENLSDVQSSAENVIDANDPLKKKKRELEKLQTEKAIRDLNANLNPQP